MRSIFFLPLLLLALPGCSQQPGKKTASANVQEIKVGGRCEDCEAIYENKTPFDQLNHTDTLPDFGGAGPNLEITGIVYQADGKTPAPGVVMYFYHTDQTGVYPTKGTERGIDKKHGYLRGWIRTNETGQYAIYTMRPASYPNSRNPAHIHAIIKEPGKSEYWIDDFLFADDPYLATERREAPRGGLGVLSPVKDGILFKAKRDIILGKNIEDYPKN